MKQKKQEPQACLSVGLKVDNQQKTYKIKLPFLGDLCRFVLKNELELFHLKHPGIPISGKVDFYVYILDEAAMIVLNQRVFGKSRPTDVISYGYLDTFPNPGSSLGGEIFVSIEQAMKVYRRYHKTPDYEFALYLVHGILHAFGHDDIDPAKRKIMKERERFYMDLFSNISTTGMLILPS